MAYSATERRWVMRLLLKMTPAERAEYERRIMDPTTDYSDGLIALAERVMLEMRR